ncbi:hypothetical protein BOTBODRAFT_34594 [Botryobasidium botryosum FD-172 SS1]|uniref:RING-type domain-containing protein n=1 Tax=Botryobasidium botryosum (strain FD-172 SS1) TaxID=930990 RepID=A0A067MKE0_BOTB1|nr:hypothetical protein BOTBODRAFT_34594 [Botryobasidium botryosum FD-172 SS1]
MGNTSSSSRDRHDDSVDLGALTPQGIYTGPQDWNQSVVAQLIIDRKLAPFYRPLEDYEEDWDDDRILAARKGEPQPASDGNTTPPHHSSPRSASKSSARPATTRDRINEAQLYYKAVECPICFLYYPRNINRSRCCDQEICTECFVQIKRADPTPTNLVSEPASCPYCVEPNFGIFYTPPSWRVGIGSDQAASHHGPRPDLNRLGSSGTSTDVQGPSGSQKARRKSMSHTNFAVVTVDQIRPDWEDKLNAMKAVAARRANRRIIMRQVGDRLIPVGITSGRIAQPVDGGGGSGEGTPPEGGRRSRRHRDNNGAASEFTNMYGIGMPGQDLEELMLMEAMRLSLLEHEAQQRRQQQEQQGSASNSNNAESNNSRPPSGSSSLPSSFISSSSSPPAPTLVATSANGPPTGTSPGNTAQPRSLTPTLPGGLRDTLPPLPHENGNTSLSTPTTSSIPLHSASSTTESLDHSPSLPRIVLPEGNGAETST